MEIYFKKIIEAIRERPFLSVLSVVVVGVAVFVAATLSNAMDNKIASLTQESANTTEAVASQDFSYKPQQNTVSIDKLKSYYSVPTEVVVNKEANRIAVNVTFEKDEALLTEHYAANAFSMEVVPVFCFYIDNGKQIKIPGTLRLGEDAKSISYYLSDIDDLQIAATYLTEETISLQNVINKDFNIYLQHKTKDSVGKTVLGTFSKSVEEYEAQFSGDDIPVVDRWKDIKNIDMTVTDEFVWFDLYFQDEKVYEQYTGKFERFGFEHGGKLFKGDFISKEYDSLYMIRLKFNEDDFSHLLKAMGEEKLTLKNLFAEYSIEVWTTDNKASQTLFCLNNTTEIRERLKGTSNN